MRSDHGNTKNAKHIKAPLIRASLCLGSDLAITEQMESGKIIAALTKLRALPAMGTVVAVICVVRATIMFHPLG